MNFYKLLAQLEQAELKLDQIRADAAALERAWSDDIQLLHETSRERDHLCTELAAANAALEDKHRAWVAAERELEAARAVVEAARDFLMQRTNGWGGVGTALTAYDAARRAGE